MSNRPSIITIGNFDGVHLGHQKIVHTAREMATAHQDDSRVLAVTFDPFPIETLRPGNGPPAIGSIGQRVTALEQAGVDEVIVLQPTADLLGMEAPAFIAWLRDAHGAVGFIEGQDFCFGKKRGGNMTMLAEMGREYGFAVRAMPRVETKLSDQSVAPISSSLIRWLIGRGRVEDAQACMGRPFEIKAQIVKGEQRGRTIDVPTINLDPAAYAPQIVPTDGVYAGQANVEGLDQPLPAAISVGIKPTFGHDQLTIEAHLIGYQANHPDELYDRHVELRFARWLRDQYPFPGIENLKEQLHRDIQAASTTA